MSSRRQQVVRNCKKHGLRVQPAVLKGMLQEDDESLEIALLFLKQKLARASLKLVTPPLWAEALESFGNEVAFENESWQLVDAFDTPKLVYNSLRQQFHHDSRDRPPLLGTAQDRLQMMAQRYLQIQQRVVRQLQTPLISIDRLLGTTGSSKQVLLGMLHRTPSGFELEDLTGNIAMHFTESTQLDPSAIYTEGSMVLVQGTYHQEVLSVDRMGMPLLESKAETQPYLPLEKREDAKSPLSVYSMANLTLDEPESIQQLEELIDIVHDDPREAILVLMGNFSTDSLTLTAALDELAHILEETKFPVLIQPGPNDTPSPCWPLPKLKSSQVKMPPNVQLISNPCRLQYGTHDVVISRQDLIRRHLDHQVVSVRSETPLAQRVLHTVLSQGHFAPKAPTYWNYDHAMSLYPLPDLVLLGLEDEEALEFSKADCQVAAPGAGWAKVTLGRRQRATKIQLSQDFEDMEE
jgi:DNA polymerase epsilon subunit 2